MLYGSGPLYLFSDVIFLILGHAGIAIFFALLTVFWGFPVPQLFEVSQELSVCFQSQRPSFFLQNKI